MKCALVCFALGLAGCFSIPSPLHPGIRGAIGSPGFGVQTTAKELPRRGEGYERYRERSTNYWGQPELVRALERTGKALHAQRAGQPLIIGDISARSGGKLLGHTSHRNGRDVDLLLFLTTLDGKPIKTPGFVRIAADGLGEIGPNQFVRFDVARQWQLVRLLLTSEDISVQLLFVSREVEALLMDYALARGEPLELIWRAATMLLEPRDSTAHDDHMHLRIACPAEATVTGCTGGGPRWDWLTPEPKLTTLNTEELKTLTYEDPPPQLRTVSGRNLSAARTAQSQ